MRSLKLTPILFLLVLSACSTLPSDKINVPVLPPEGTLKSRVLLSPGMQQLDSLAVIVYRDTGEYRAQFYSEMGILLFDFGYIKNETVLYSIPRGFPEILITQGLHLDILTLVYGKKQNGYRSWNLDTAAGTVSVLYSRNRPRYEAQWQFLSLVPEIKAKGLFE